MMYFLLLLHNFKSSVTLECWIKRNSLQDEWIMPAMTSSTGITLRACSALSRKQLTFYWIPFFFFFLYIFPFYFFFAHKHTHTNTHTATTFLFVQWLCRRRRNASRETHEKNEKASSSFFLSPLFCVVVSNCCPQHLPNRHCLHRPDKNVAGKKQESSRWRLTPKGTHTQHTQHSHTNKPFFF